MSINKISSKQNKKIKDLNAAKIKKGPWADYVIAEGHRLCDEVLHSDAEIAAVFLDENLPEHDYIAYIQRAKESFVLPRDLFVSISETKNPQGILLLIEPFAKASLSELDKLLLKVDFPKNDKKVSLVVLENVQDPGNLGTILRTAHAFAYDAAVLVGDCARSSSSKVVRSSMGAVFHMPIFELKDSKVVLDWCKENRVIILATALDGLNLKKYKNDEKFSLWIGNEGNGLSALALNMADYKLTIPMPGGAESLNAGIAAGIALYELS